MPGLDGRLVEDTLPIKKDFKPVQQAPRRMAREVTQLVVEEVKKLFRAGYIRTSRYTMWISSIVPVLKKNGKIRVRIDFRDLNRATPKDEYPMPVADDLIDKTAGHQIMSFIDRFSGYNQIFITEEDIHKTAFRCPLGIFAWVVMSFGLKNAGATYQRAMNAIFDASLGKTVEVYIDDIVVKLTKEELHVDHLRNAFIKMRKRQLKLNPLKCAFGVKAGQFLGFLVHQRSIEVDQNKVKAIQNLTAPKSKMELQAFLGRVNYLHRFIGNVAGKTEAFGNLLRRKNDFMWIEKHEETFNALKKYLTHPPVLVPP
ncbi:hypothetical protein MLD38_021344 [Melastoma candidum]|uniref:Uncharacterized protein n=1 Tax=Melastoma candidum TaxID=119954 RepID=A0ACB9QHN0_9MYRT|nr:hypothetical protein MLD38_021344 [Melastoma candidum]